MFVQIFVYCWAGNEIMLKVATTLQRKTYLNRK